MNSIKLSIAAAAGAIVLYALVSATTASATVMCNGSCTETYGVGTTIAAQLTEGPVVFKPPIGTIECSKSSFEAEITNAGGATETVTTTLKSLGFSECNATVTVLAKGSLGMHKDPTGAKTHGTITETNSELTIEFVGFHCIFKSTESDYGTFDPVDLFQNHSPTITKNAKTPRTGGRSGAFCGTEMESTAHYEVTSPFSLAVG